MQIHIQIRIQFRKEIHIPLLMEQMHHRLELVRRHSGEEEGMNLSGEQLGRHKETRRKGWLKVLHMSFHHIQLELECNQYCIRSKLGMMLRVRRIQCCTLERNQWLGIEVVGQQRR